MKQNYNKNSVTRKFQPGDKVLAFLPVSGKPLQARYSGPYVVEKKESELNYVIVTPDRCKHTQLCHVNMLKPYNERKKVVMSVESADNDTYSVSEDLFNLSESTKLKNSDIFNNLDDKLAHLPPSQHKGLKKILQEHEELFPDDPSRTNPIYHDVDIVNNASPIKQHPYCLSPAKQKSLKDEKPVPCRE